MEESVSLIIFLLFPSINFSLLQKSQSIFSSYCIVALILTSSSFKLSELLECYWICVATNSDSTSWSHSKLIPFLFFLLLILLLNEDSPEILKLLVGKESIYSCIVSSWLPFGTFIDSCYYYLLISVFYFLRIIIFYFISSNIVYLISLNFIIFALSTSF